MRSSWRGHSDGDWPRGFPGMCSLMVMNAAVGCSAGPALLGFSAWQVRLCLESLSFSRTWGVAAPWPWGPSWLLRCSIWSPAHVSTGSVPKCWFYQKEHQTFLSFLEVLGIFYLKCALEIAKQALNCSLQYSQHQHVAQAAKAWKGMNRLGSAGASLPWLLTWLKHRGDAWNTLLTGQIEYLLAYIWK